MIADHLDRLRHSGPFRNLDVLGLHDPARSVSGIAQQLGHFDRKFLGYLVENRTYVGYDSTLRDGPYQFDKPYTAPDHVERFPFQDGMLVWAVDETYTDNNTIDHQGHGLALPIDANPVKFTYSDGTGPSNRRQPFDATFGLQTMDPVALHKEVLVGKGKSQTIQSLAAVGSDGKTLQKATFSDAKTDAYFDASNPLGGVYVAGHGVTVTVTSQNTGGTMGVTVNNPAE